MDGIESDLLLDRTENINLPDNYDPLSGQINRSITNIENSNLLDCDEECQRNENLENSYIAYVDARNRKAQAPQEYERMKRNYLIQKYGEEGYRDIIDENNQQRVNTFLDRKENQFNSIKNELDKHKKTLDTLHSSNSRIDELISKFKRENTELERNIRHRRNDENISNRETYYTNDRIMFYYNIYSILRYINWFLLLLFIVILILSNKYKKRIYQYFAGGLIIFAILPFHRYIIAPLYNT